MSDACIFCRIGDGTIPATLVASNAHGVAFRDLHPQAPSHLLVIPRRHVASLAEATDAAELGALMLLAAEVAIPTPPPEHPRLYLRASDVAKLPQRMAHPVLAPVVAKLRKLAAQFPQLRMEWEALNYLVKPDAAKGRATIVETLALLKACKLADKQDACRETGRMMVTGAIVYDWLYALLTAEQKREFVRELVRLAKTQECGYPPTRQGSVTGHSSEAMIMRDMLSAGVAIYDEEPEMYRLAAGRFFREHLPARNWFPAQISPTALAMWPFTKPSSAGQHR